MEKDSFDHFTINQIGTNLSWFWKFIENSRQKYAWYRFLFTKNISFKIYRFLEVMAFYMLDLIFIWMEQSWKG